MWAVESFVFCSKSKESRLCVWLAGIGECNAESRRCILYWELFFTYFFLCFGLELSVCHLSSWSRSFHAIFSFFPVFVAQFLIYPSRGQGSSLICKFRSQDFVTLPQSEGYRTFNNVPCSWIFIMLSRIIIKKPTYKLNSAKSQSPGTFSIINSERDKDLRWPMKTWELKFRLLPHGRCERTWNSPKKVTVSRSKVQDNFSAPCEWAVEKGKEKKRWLMVWIIGFNSVRIAMVDSTVDDCISTLVVVGRLDVSGNRS